MAIYRENRRSNTGYRVLKIITDNCGFTKKMQTLQTKTPTAPIIAKILQITTPPKRKLFRNLPLYNVIPVLFTIEQYILKYKCRRNAGFINNHRNQYKLIFVNEIRRTRSKYGPFLL